MKAADYFPFRHEIRQGTLRAVSRLPEEHLMWKPPGGLHSIMGWLRHIAQAEDWWIQAGVFGREDFTPRRKYQLPDKESVLAYLKETRDATEALLQEWPAERLREEIPHPAGLRGAPHPARVSLHWVFNRLFEHEVHHRGQILLHIRLMGLEPPLV